MSIGYMNRRKTIKRLRKQFATKPLEELRFIAAEYGDRWVGLAATLALRDQNASPR